MRLQLSSFLPVACGLLLIVSSEAGIIFTVEAPGVSQTSRPGAITETFNTLLVGSTPTSPLGVYSGGSVRGPDNWGGTGAAGDNYYLTGDSTLTLSQNATYFGFWWNSYDNNQVSLYDQHDVLSGTYDLNSLSSAYVPAGKGQFWAYVNFDTNDGTLISRIRFYQGNFESDNHSVVFALPPDVPASSVPDGASTMALLGLTMGGIGWLRRKIKD